MTRSSVFRSSAIVFFALFAVDSRATTIYDPASDFETGFTTQSNPNGVWSYGYSSGFTSPVTLFNRTVQPGFDSSNEQLWLSSSVNIGGSPAVEFNNGPAFNDGNVAALADQILLVAGIGGQYADLIFTAPATGTYSVEGSFLGDQINIGTFVGVVADGSVIFSSSVTAEGQTVPFDSHVSLAAGNAVVFSVGPDGGLQNTGLSLTITQSAATPEPSSLILFGTGTNRSSQIPQTEGSTRISRKLNPVAVHMSGSRTSCQISTEKTPCLRPRRTSLCVQGSVRERDIARWVHKPDSMLLWPRATVQPDIH